MKIGLLGYGVVGVGVCEWVAQCPDMHVEKVFCRRPKAGIESITVYDAQEIINDPTIDTVVEVMGGLHPAYELVSAALKKGKNVITANKNLISAYYSDLIALAYENGAALRCTAACGGGIPWLVNLERCKRLDTVCEISGIMNGTTNFIMDAMHRSPVDFSEILKQAQELGYAEADPRADIDGDDIRRKLVISANVAFDTLLREEDVPMFGIRTVSAADIEAFRQHGFVCKLIASALRSGEKVSAYLEPTLVGSGDLEAAVPSNYNLITYTGEAIGPQSFFGQGAGRYPTAYNVVQDCLDVLRGQRDFYAAAAAPAEMDPTAVMHPYYVRTEKEDGWLSGHIADRWDCGVVTDAVSVSEMLTWAKQHRAVDPTCFIAGIR
ncbi:MAG: homoserine dehydrogenase [Clostridiales bacterium]|nr:homoserine dehydrogenase [Clostridiales bacterium]